MKRLYFIALVSLIFVFTGCSSDDDTISGSGLVGRWKFVEMLDGSKGMSQPDQHIMEIKENGTIVYTYDDGNNRAVLYEYDDNSKYGTNDPVILITNLLEYGIVYKGPYSCEIGSTTLKLHYSGFYFTDHIPETYFYKRIK